MICHRGCSRVKFNNARLFHLSPIIIANNLFNAVHLKSMTESVHFDYMFIEYHSSNTLTSYFNPPNLKGQLFLV